jgi:hypothetical protein
LVIGLSTGSAAGAAGNEISDISDGFSFALPANWIQVPLNHGDLAGIISVAVKKNPNLKNLISGAAESAIKNHIKLFVVGPVVSGFMSNVNVYVSSSKNQLTGRAFLESTDAQMKITYAVVKMTKVRTSIKTSPMGQILESSYQLPRSMSKGTPVYQIQLVVEHQAHIEVVTISTTSAVRGQSILRSVISSWRWT